MYGKWVKLVLNKNSGRNCKVIVTVNSKGPQEAQISADVPKADSTVCEATLITDWGKTAPLITATAHNGTQVSLSLPAHLIK